MVGDGGYFSVIVEGGGAEEQLGGARHRGDRSAACSDLAGDGHRSSIATRPISSASTTSTYSFRRYQLERDASTSLPSGRSPGESVPRRLSVMDDDDEDGEEEDTASGLERTAAAVSASCPTSTERSRPGTMNGMLLSDLRAACRTISPHVRETYEEMRSRSSDEVTERREGISIGSASAARSARGSRSSTSSSSDVCGARASWRCWPS